MKKTKQVLCLMALTVVLFTACNNKTIDYTATEYPPTSTAPAVTASISPEPTTTTSPSPPTTSTPAAKINPMPAPVYFPCIEDCCIVKDFLSRFSVIFYNNGSGHIYSAYCDNHGSVMSGDVYLVYSMYRLWGNSGYWNFYVHGFSVYGIEDRPSIIRMLYWVDGTCMGMGSMLYIKTDNEFRQLGSMIDYARPGYVKFQPLINEVGDIIVFVGDMEPRFKAINDEGNFEIVGDWMCWDWREETVFDARTDKYIVNFVDELIISAGTDAEIRVAMDELYEILAAGQMYNLIPGFPPGNFEPIIRMNDFEQHLWETVPQLLETSPTITAEEFLS